MKQELITNRFSDDLVKEFHNRLGILNRTKQVIHFTLFNDEPAGLHKAIIFYYD